MLLPLFGNAVDLLSVPAPSFSPPASAGGDSYVSGISGDGRYVLFSSTANNLTHRSNGAPYLLPRPGKMNAFVHDRVLGTTTLVSRDANGVASCQDDSTPTAISTNGQFVLFESASRNLAAGTSIRTNNTEIFLGDLVNKTTTLVTARVGSGSLVAGATDSIMTPDARYIAFSSADSTFVADDTNLAFDVFVRDMNQGVTRMASAGFTNRVSSFAPVMTPDGKFVAFEGTLFSGNPTQDVYVCDMDASNTFCVSTNAHTLISSGVPQSYGQELSADGKYVVFQSSAQIGGTKAWIFRHNIQSGAEDIVTSNGLPANATQPFDMSPDGRFVAFIGQTNGHAGIFLWDGQTTTTTYVSVTTNGAIPANLTCDSPAVDTTGRFVSFSCVGGGLVTNAVGLFPHIYRRDLQAGTTELVDAGLDGNATNRTFNSDFYMSADGQAIAFDSPDTDLVEGDGNGASDVFVRDFNSETTELASAADATLPTQTSGFADKRSRASVSADGHFAVFIARGEGLVAGQTNRYRQVFVRDLVNQSNSVVSVDTNGLDSADGSATECAISGDGRYVAFTSLADNLVPNDSNHLSDVFLRDLQTGTTILVSTNFGISGSGNGVSFSPSIGLDGRFLTFESQADSIARSTGPFASATRTNLFLYDLQFHTTYIITTNGFSAAAVTPDGRYVAFVASLTSAGSSNLYVWDSQFKQRVFTNLLSAPATDIAISTNGQWIAYISGQLSLLDRLTKSNSVVSNGQFVIRANPRFSGDARYLVYATKAANSSQDTNLARDVYFFDILTRSNSLVSRSFVTGKAPGGNSDFPSISADGRYIVYQSDAPDIVPQDNNGRVKDIFLYDQQAGSTMLLSASVYGTGTADYVSQSPAFTADGQTVAFQSWASDIAVNDFNQGSDLFLFKILSSADATNPPPVLTGQILLSPGSGAGAGQTNPQLTWAAAPGFSYQVQYKTNLTDDTWLPVNGSVVIQNGVGYVNDLAPDSDHRFYRIIAY
jgi:Tol biopolymer transport system component